jgi:hypothetical protein
MFVDFFFQVFFEMTLFYRQHSSRQRMLVLQEQGTERRQWHFFLGKLSTTFFTEWIFIPIYKTQWVNLFIDSPTHDLIRLSPVEKPSLFFKKKKKKTWDGLYQTHPICNLGN